jgi:pyruvate kinase
MRHTKIVCTLGPSVDSKEKIRELILAGMNVARLNFSHGSYEEHGQRIQMIKELREELDIPVAIMLDTKGPEIRLGKIKGDEFEVKDGSRLTLVKEEIEGSPKAVTLTPPLVIDEINQQQFLLLDDGYMMARVVEKGSDYCVIEFDHGGVLRSRKSLNIPGLDMVFPLLTDKDREDLKFGCEQDVDYIAASFIRSDEDVMEIKKLVRGEGKPTIGLIAKIENRKGVENFDSILQVADGIMVARGDLGVELPLHHVPRLQKEMIRKSYMAGKTSVTATQMLESMIKNPRPTRAEASDVANAIYDSTSAVMLSGETAMGRFPIETVKIMGSIVKEAESDFDYKDFLSRATYRDFPDIPSSVCASAIRSAYHAHAKALFVFTTSGQTAKQISRFRPQMPILALTTQKKVYHQLALCWGIIPLFCDQALTIEEANQTITDYALEHGIVKKGDIVVITAGTPFGKAGTTNMIVVENIGDVLLRGSYGWGGIVTAPVVLFPTPNDPIKSVKGKILVLSTCDRSYLPLMQASSGVILQNHLQDKESEAFLSNVASEYSIPFVMEVQGAGETLEENQVVTIDPHQATIFKG